MRTVRQNAAVGFLALLTLLGSLAGRAEAQAPGVNETATARALFEQGMAAVDAGDFETATDRLERSLSIRDSEVVRVNLALALIEIGHLVEASEHLRRVERESEAGSEIHALAAARLEAVQARMGRLQIDVRGPRDGVEVQLDGAAVPDAAVGIAQPADPGRHRVTLHRGGRELAAADVTVASGQVATVALVAPAPTAEETAAAAPTEPEPVAEPASGGIEREWWLWTLIGVLAAGAVAGIVAGVLVSEQQTPEGFLSGSSGAVFNTLVELP